MAHVFLDDVRQLQQQAAQLVLYQAVLSAAPGQAWLAVLDALASGTSPKILSTYGQWFYTLADCRQTWREYVVEALLVCDNPFTQQAQRSPLSAIAPPLVRAVEHDLRLLQALYASDGVRLAGWVQEATRTQDLPILEMPSMDPEGNGNKTNGKAAGARNAIRDRLGRDDWATLLQPLAQYYRQAGVGLFARYRAFRWQRGELVGVAHPDPIRLNELAAYEAPRHQLIQNTEALLSGYPALNVLLYGSRGSGKSSTVKALLNAFGDRGLRLIEVAKSDLRDLAHIVDRLRDTPQKFIIFVDDLSFEEDDEAFKALKVVLEGNIVARPANVVVYATSNRRHLVREFMDDRPRPRDADEVHAWDTMQEKLSFSDRFGLTLTFEPADQTTYLAIVHHLASQAGLAIEISDLEFRALQWATRHNGRSGRTVRQFIDALQAELARPADH
ncbi:MAG: ATP-binding protein [Cyanobacteria bacterium J06638_20]